MRVPWRPYSAPGACGSYYPSASTRLSPRAGTMPAPVTLRTTMDHVQEIIDAQRQRVNKELAEIEANPARNAAEKANHDIARGRAENTLAWCDFAQAQKQRQQ